MGAAAGNSRKRLRSIEPVEVDLPITVGQFVKAAGLASTGGEAKLLVTGGDVSVNGSVEIRRGHKLAPGDVVSLGGKAARVVSRSQPAGVSPTTPAPHPRS
jgi:ribosome-associated protein